MDERLIVDKVEYEKLCSHIVEAGIVAFDSEFVSESSYRPVLCLLQFATPERRVAVDPFEVGNLDRWWDIMADDKTTVVVHGGQAEVRFCLENGGNSPHKLVDVQIAQGLLGRSYPLSYHALVSRVISMQLMGKETRTEWRRRPLSQQQIDYALEDVEHTLDIWQRQSNSLAKLHRESWAEAEFQRMIGEIGAEMNRNGWERLSGVHKLRSRDLAVAIELYNWREQEARRQDRPARRVLRDDLIMELARRHPTNSKDLFATRDMNRSNYKRAVTELLECVERGLAVPKSELPRLPESADRERNSDEHILGKLLGIALANRCCELNVALPLVGTSADLRALARWHVHSNRDGPPPKLARGWRAEVCGDLLEDLLDGKIALRVADPQSEHPLIFEPTDKS